MLLWLLTSLEHAAPTDPSVDAFVHSIEPDLVVVSPLILARSDLGDYLATARARRIPAVFAVASWDNLSSKGLVTQVPEWVTLWNEIQKREAVLYHRVPAERIVVTGSIQHDQWFDRSPASTPEEFKRRRGLPVWGADFMLGFGAALSALLLLLVLAIVAQLLIAPAFPAPWVANPGPAIAV